MSTITERVDSFFRVSERGSTIKTEVRAGAATFLAMVYILAVMPNMMADGGMGREEVFTATAVSAIVATLIMGLYAKYPVAQAPAMGTNAFFTYTIVCTMGYTWQEALLATFLSGVLFFLISVSGLRETMIKVMPRDLRLAIGAGIGAFLLFVGMQNAHIIVDNPSTLVSLGDLADKGVLLALFGIILTCILFIKKVAGSVFIGIMVTTVLGIAIGVAHAPDSLVSVPSAPYLGDFIDGFSTADWNLTFVIVVLCFLMVDFFDTTGTLMAVSKESGMMDAEGNIKDGKKAFIADSLGTIFGAAVGSSTVSSYAESTVGIESGARTGLAAVTVACLFAFALLFGPVFQMVTYEATVCALFIVAVLLMSSLKDVDFRDPAASIAAVTCILMMILTYSITDGIGFGIMFYAVCKAAKDGIGSVHPVLYALAAVFALYFATSALTF